MMHSQRVTEEEPQETRKHPVVDRRILSSTSEFAEMAQYIHEHQENWDGTGYPKGLIGEEITRVARIIAVADAYDAMTSKRSYRSAMSREEAFRELTRCAGTQFDPDIVKVFVK